ncbi:MAG: PepSY domain-containing protein, partial [Myxococcales bacterium]|nr:PepSY domain-containing protein [Myxococcales bacterium]
GVLEESKRHAPELKPEVVRLHRIGHVGGYFDVWGHVDGPPKAHGMLRVDSTNGEVIASQMPSSQGSAGATRGWVQTLHYAEFGGLPLKFLYFALALASCGAFLTGNWVWLSRREKRESSRGNRALRRLTLGIGAGTWVALGAMFLSSRLLPLSLSGRGKWEEASFFISLLVCVIWALVARELQRLWWRQLALAGVASALTPVAALGISSAGLFGARSSAAVVAVDSGLLAAGTALCALAAALYRAQRETRASEVSHTVSPLATEAENV